MGPANRRSEKRAARSRQSLLARQCRRTPLGQTALQLRGGQLGGLIVSGKLETEMIAIDCDPQTRRPCRQTEQFSKFVLAQIVNATVETQQDSGAALGY
jgi:hypothetical protein